MALFPELTNTEYLGIPYWILFVAAFIILLGVAMIVYPPFLWVFLSWVFIISPVWIPLLLITVFFSQWRAYVRARFIARQTPILLEIRIPRHIHKTPKAMDLVFAGLNVGPGETTFISRWWEGKVRPWWSLEIVSIEGRINFYIWAWSQHREFIESQFYSQFPNIEIHEVEDYSQGVRYDPEVTNVWGMEYVLEKPDAYPIKTYVDFELDKEAKKSEQIIDPISGVFEKLSSLGPGEQMWVQIVIRRNKGATIDSSLWGTKKKWKDEAREEIERIYQKSKPQTKDLVTGEISDGYPLLKPAEVNVIKALERSIEKSGFDTGIRAVYLAKPANFKGHKIPTFIVNFWNTFSSGYLNGFEGTDWHSSLNYPWQDFRGLREAYYSRKILDAYHRRSFFHPPYDRPRFVLTTEELATIFHFPTEETKAPGLQRLSSTKGEPPSNLPT